MVDNMTVKRQYVTLEFYKAKKKKKVGVWRTDDSKLPVFYLLKCQIFRSFKQCKLITKLISSKFSN